jgi:hypothetical protein
MQQPAVFDFGGFIHDCSRFQFQVFVRSSGTAVTCITHPPAQTAVKRRWEIKKQRARARCSVPADDRLIAGIQVLEIPAAGSPINVPISFGAGE